MTINLSNYIGGQGNLVRSARTGDTVLALTDKGTLIDITSGTFSQTFTAAATLGAGWWCYIRNSGTGDITLDPNGAELIDGLASYVMYPGECRLITCTGTAFVSVVVSPFFKTFTTTGTFTKPPGYSQFGAFIWSGGASGGQQDGATRGGCGGGGFPFTLQSSTLAATETITVGAGGAAIANPDTGNQSGGNSSIGTLAIVYGADVGVTGGHIKIGGVALVAQYAVANYESGFGAAPAQSALSMNTVYGGTAPVINGSADSASSIYGGAAGGSHDGSTLRAGGTSQFGGNGGASSVTGNGTAGTAPAGGGGSCKNGNVSGAGARGEVRIWGIA